jgi:hypothetical protein
MTGSRADLDTAAFLDSEHARGLRGAAAEHAADLVRLFLRCAYDEIGKAPRHLEAEDMHALLCHVLPAHLGRRDPKAASVRPVLGAYLDHLVGTAVVPQAFELRQQLEADAWELERIVRTGEAHAHGLPAGKGTTIRHRAAKVGRNDPCPCGSGKKFKQCCGRAR